MRAIGREVYDFPVPRTLAEVDRIYPGLDGGRIALVALAHPSLYFANVHRRCFGTLRGKEAERAMEARRGAGDLPPQNPHTFDV